MIADFPFDPSHEIFTGNMNQQEGTVQVQWISIGNPTISSVYILQSHDTAEQVN